MGIGEKIISFSVQHHINTSHPLTFKPASLVLQNVSISLSRRHSYQHQTCQAQRAEYLTVALATTDDAPRVGIDDREILLAARSERIVEVVAEPRRLFPSILGISKEHAEKMTGTGLTIVAAICLAGVHDAQVVDELDVALLAI